MPDSPSVKKLVSVGPEIAEGFEDFHKGIADAAPFVRPEHANSNDDISLMYFTSGTTGEPKMVAHDFTYPLGHIVTGSFWHNLHEKTEPYLLQFLGKIKADPAITLTGIGLQQTPTGCSLTVCFLYNCKYAFSGVLPGLSVVRTRSLTDIKVTD